jgi:hypothetical protein
VSPNQPLEIIEILDLLDFATKRLEIRKELRKITGDTRQTADGNRVAVQGELAFH